MALDPRIILQGRVPDLAQAAQQGSAIGTNFRQAPLRNQLLQQSFDQGEQRGQINDQVIQQNQQAIQAERMQQAAVGAELAVKNWESGNIEGVLDNIRDTFPSEEEQTQQLAQFQDDPKAYMDGARNLVDVVNRQSQSAANVQFGAQSTFKDSEGNLFFGTTRRNPNNGAVESILAPIDGSNRKPVGKIQQTGQFGQTAAESTQKRVAEAGKIVAAEGEAEVKTPLGKIKLDETKAKTQSDKQDIIDAKNTRRNEANGAVLTINDLLAGDKFSKAFGRVVSSTPGILQSQEAIDAKASLDQVIGLLSLESRQKLKGQGTISEGEAKTLSQSATILANPLISDKAARKELRKVRNVFEDAAERNQLDRSTVENTVDTGITAEEFRLMTPAQQAATLREIEAQQRER